MLPIKQNKKGRRIQLKKVGRRVRRMRRAASVIKIKR
jgi:hypothetical protein